jgi:hypothetical protein
MQACLKFGLSKGTILTFDYTEQLEQEGIQINVTPAWQFFLSRSG